MCGIVGFSGPKDEVYDKRLIKTLLYINSIQRGEDATGIFTPKTGTKKSLDKGSDFVNNSKLDFESDSLFIGHVRSKTIGWNTVDNAHPFERGNCILVHNGTLDNYFDLRNKYNLGWQTYNVDSDILTGCIDKSDSFTPIGEIKGAAALLFYDKRIPYRLYAFTNGERPLFKGYIGAGLYISSIEESLKLIGCIHVKAFKPDVLYTIEQGEIKNTKKIKNDPYIENIKRVGFDYSQYPVSEAKMNMGIGCFVRAKNAVSIYTKLNIRESQLIIGNYYEILEKVSSFIFKVKDHNKSKVFTVTATNLEDEDFIYDGDYVKALSDIFLTLKNGDAAKVPELRKGEITEVTYSGMDGTMKIAVPDKKYSVIINKNCFRKLNEEEYEELIISGFNINSFMQVPFDIHKVNKIIDTLPEPTVDAETNLVDEPEDENLNINQEAKVIDLITEPELKVSINEMNTSLIDYFIGIDDKLGKLKDDLRSENKSMGIATPDRLMKAIEEMENMTYKIHNKLYKKELENAR